MRKEEFQQQIKARKIAANHKFPVLEGFRFLEIADQVIANFFGVSKTLVALWRRGDNPLQPHRLIVLNALLWDCINMIRDDSPFEFEGDNKKQYADFYKRRDSMVEYARACHEAQHEINLGFPTSKKWEARELLEELKLKQNGKAE